MLDASCSNPFSGKGISGLLSLLSYQAALKPVASDNDGGNSQAGDSRVPSETPSSLPCNSI